VQVNIYLFVSIATAFSKMAITFFIECFGRFPMSFAHGIVLCLASQRESFGSSAIISVPRLSRGLQKLVPDAAMLDSFLTILKILLVRPLACF
jgi:hypothetical protein